MADYYSAKDILDKAQGTDAYCQIKSILESIKAADVEPVRHGKWAVKKGVFTPGGDPLLYCPYCNGKDSLHMGGIEMPQNWDWCPVCGVKMDLEG